MLIGTRETICFIAPDSNEIGNAVSIPSGALRVRFSTKLVDAIEVTNVELIDYQNLGIFGTQTTREILLSEIFDLDGNTFDDDITIFLNKNKSFFVKGLSGSGSGGSQIETTQDELAVLVENAQLTIGSNYFLTDIKVILTAISDKNFDINAKRLMLIPASYDDTYIGNKTFKSIWYANLDINIDEYCIWNALVWKNLTGVNTVDSPDNDVVNWELVPKDNYTDEYVYETFAIKINPQNYRIIEQSDAFGNCIKLSTNEYNYISSEKIETADWGFGNSGFYQNTFIDGHFLNNRRTYSYIHSNSFEGGDMIGNQVLTNAGSITNNKFFNSSLLNNILTAGGVINGNTVSNGLINDNILNNGSIYMNYVEGGSITQNTLGHNIANNKLVLCSIYNINITNGGIIGNIMTTSSLLNCTLTSGFEQNYLVKHEFDGNIATLMNTNYIGTTLIP